MPGFKEPVGGKPVGIKSKWFVMEARGDELAQIGRFFEQGLLKATVNSVWELEDLRGFWHNSEWPCKRKGGV